MDSLPFPTAAWLLSPKIRSPKNSWNFKEDRFKGRRMTMNQNGAPSPHHLCLGWISRGTGLLNFFSFRSTSLSHSSLSELRHPFDVFSSKDFFALSIVNLDGHCPLDSIEEKRVLGTQFHE